MNPEGVDAIDGRSHVTLAERLLLTKSSVIHSSFDLHPGSVVLISSLSYKFRIVFQEVQSAGRREALRLVFSSLALFCRKAPLYLHTCQRTIIQTLGPRTWPNEIPKIAALCFMKDPGNQFTAMLRSMVRAGRKCHNQSHPLAMLIAQYYLSRQNKLHSYYQTNYLALVQLYCDYGSQSYRKSCTRELIYLDCSDKSQQVTVSTCRLHLNNRDCLW